MNGSGRQKVRAIPNRCASWDAQKAVLRSVAIGESLKKQIDHPFRSTAEWVVFVWRANLSAMVSHAAFPFFENPLL